MTTFMRYINFFFPAIYITFMSFAELQGVCLAVDVNVVVLTSFPFTLFPEEGSRRNVERIKVKEEEL